MASKRIEERDVVNRSGDVGERAKNLYATKRSENANDIWNDLMKLWKKRGLGGRGRTISVPTE